VLSFLGVKMRVNGEWGTFGGRATLLWALFIKLVTTELRPSMLGGLGTHR
jgi:hypothetical protein